jgi:hypothetical protein
MYSILKSRLPVLFAGIACAVQAFASPAPGLPAYSPLFFEPLPSEPGASLRFVSRGQSFAFGIGASEADIVLQKRGAPTGELPPGRERLARHGETTVRAVHLKFLGANPAAVVAGEGELPGKINYFIGDDRTQWRCGVSTFAKVRVPDLYPGISLVYYGNHRQLEYDFELAPGADPRLISLRLEGMDSLRISDEGDLMIRLGDDEVRQAAPEIYQVSNGSRQPIKGQYRLKDANTVEVAVENYDSARPLIIDPQLTYSSYFGGPGNETAYEVKVDTNTGDVYLCGETLSTTFVPTNTPTYTNAFQLGKINGDAFLAKFDATLTNLLYFTYLGGTNDDGALDLAIDSSGHAYITGFTGSTNFPTILPDGAFGLSVTNQRNFDTIARAFPSSAFVAEFDTTLDGVGSLKFSGYLGGNSQDEGIGLALDETNAIYVTGYTYSTNFPLPNGYQTHGSGSNDVFLVKIGPGAAGGVLYGSLLGGTNIDEGQGVAASGGIAFVTGYTGSTNFPVTTNVMTNGLQLGINKTLNATNAFAKYKSSKAVPLDAFVAVFNTSLTGTNSLICSTLFGGTNSDAGFRIVLAESNAASRNVYITGNTESFDFPTNGASPIGRGVLSNNFNFDAILVKLQLPTTSDPANLATNLLSFPFGGTLNDVGWDIALDPAGDIFIVGVTASVTNFPNVNTNTFLRSTNMGANDAFVTAFAPNAASLLYSVYFGGTKNDFGYGIAADANGAVYIVGQTYSTNGVDRHSTNSAVTNDFPLVNAAQARSSGTNDAFLAKIDMDAPLTATVSPTPKDTLVGWDSTFNVLVSGGDPAGRYLWKKDGVPLTDTNHIGGLNSSSITISNITPADAGSYTANVSNGAGGVISSAGILNTVAPFPTSLTISGTNVLISFSSTDHSDTKDSFILQRAGTVTGRYTNAPSSLFTGASGVFQVTAPKEGNTMFYRLKHN